MGVVNPDLPSALQVSCVQMHWARNLSYNLERTRHFLQRASAEGSHVVLFPEAHLTGYHFPYAVTLSEAEVRAALDECCREAAVHRLWVVAGTLMPTADRLLNIAHVINPVGEIVHEYAKVHLAGRDERQYCRAGEKLSLFELAGVPATIVICRDGRHPELFRIPAMAGARILLQPSCSTNPARDVAWKRAAGRAQQPAGPTTGIYHCVANTIGQSPDGRESTSGASFIRDPQGLPLAEAGWYQEEMITAVLDPAQATRRYALDSFEHPACLQPHWETMVQHVQEHAGDPVR